MIVQAVDLVTEAAGRIGDPSRRRVTDTLWLAILKQVVRDVCVRGVPILEERYTFDITTDDRYAYPDGTVGVTVIGYSADPSDPDSYYDLEEKDRDWLRAQTQAQYQVGDPRYFVPLPSWWHAYPKSETSIVNGGRMDVLVIPTLPASVDAGTVELPAAAIEHITEGMTIEGLKSLKMYDLAGAREAKWLAFEGDLSTILRGRSTDKRKRFVPVNAALQRQV